MAHNASFNKGIEGAQTVHFPEVLEGGGLAYIEAFFQKQALREKAIWPFVQAIGIPSIVRTAWTDMQDNPIPVGTKIYWGSHVKLHIYTSGLYGQEVEVTLKDKDTFILDSDDDLNFGGQASFMSEVDAVRANKMKKVKKVLQG